jgi:hypothetical protein
MRIISVRFGKPDNDIRDGGIMYFDPVGETFMESFVLRRTRPHTEYRKLLPKVFEKLKMEPVKVSWSQRAGCPCGCSPGFKIRGGDIKTGTVIWVRVK